MTEQTLNEFLLARIAAREQQVAFVQDFIPDEGNQGEYIDPARVLAECEAMRRIVEMHPTRWIYVEANRKMGEQEPRAECVGGPVYDDEVRILGEVYAGHEDYRKEWRMQDTPNPFGIRS